VLTLNQPENAWYVPAFAMVSDKDSTKYLCLQNKVQHLLGADLRSILHKKLVLARRKHIYILVCFTVSYWNVRRSL